MSGFTKMSNTAALAYTPEYKGGANALTTTQKEGKALLRTFGQLAIGVGGMAIANAIGNPALSSALGVAAGIIAGTSPISYPLHYYSEEIKNAIKGLFGGKNNSGRE